MSKIHNVEQGSAAWYQIRLGLPTASKFDKIITPVEGKLSAQWQDYAYRLVAERCLKDSMDEQLKVEWIERGKEFQPYAAAQFEFTTEKKIEPVGFITDNALRMGCSPDGLIVGSAAQAVEIKCPSPWVQMQYLLDGPGAKHRPQVQGQILIGEFELVHFYSYHPRMPPRHIETRPDDAYIEKMRAALDEFCDRLAEMHERAKALGAYVITERPRTPLDQAYGEQAAEEDQPLQMVIPEGGTILDGG